MCNYKAIVLDARGQKYSIWFTLQNVHKPKYYRSGDLQMDIALQTTDYLSKERDYMPWSAASSQLSFVSSMLARHPLYGSFAVSGIVLRYVV